MLLKNFARDRFDARDYTIFYFNFNERRMQCFYTNLLFATYIHSDKGFVIHHVIS